MTEKLVGVKTDEEEESYDGFVSNGGEVSRICSDEDFKQPATGKEDTKIVVDVDHIVDENLTIVTEMEKY